MDFWTSDRECLKRAPEPLPDLLAEPALLTAKIEQFAGSPVRVTVLAEDVQAIGADECRALDVTVESAYARRVQLRVRERPWVFAETLVPEATLRGHAWLSALGTRSLGTALAAYSGGIAGPLEWARLGPSHRLHQAACDAGSAPASMFWARRRWHALDGVRLLVQEVFLPVDHAQ